MRLDLYQLRAFYTVAQTLNYTEAARRLYVTQSAVSHALRKLERAAGGPLLRRAGGGLALTPAGHTLYKACGKVFCELERAEEELASGGGSGGGSIRLGATVEFGTTLLVKYLKGFIADNPGISLDFHFSHDLLEPLLKDEVDMAIDCRVHRAEGVERVPLFREEYVVIASPSYARRLKAPRDLERCRALSVDKGCAWWGNFLNALPPAGRPAFREVMEIDHIRGIVNAAIESIGAGFVPKYCVLKELRAGTLVNPFPRLKLLEDNLYVYQKSGRAGLARHRKLLDYLMHIRSAQLTRAG